MFGISDTYLIILFILLFSIVFIFLLVMIVAGISVKKLGNYLPKFPEENN